MRGQQEDRQCQWVGEHPTRERDMELDPPNSQHPPPSSIHLWKEETKQEDIRPERLFLGITALAQSHVHPCEND